MTHKPLDSSPSFPALGGQSSVPDPCVFVIFGASGDLTKRLLIPSLFNLYMDGLLPDNFTVLGLSRDYFSAESFRKKMSEDIREHSRRESFDDKRWQTFCDNIHYLQGKFDDPETFQNLNQFLNAFNGRHNTQENVLFYMATPPSIAAMVSEGLDAVKLNQETKGWRRIIVEKPFGTDLASAKKLNKILLSYWKESQIYRIDHYLGKEAVQNLVAFRFANGMFEPLWNHTHIDHIQITANEQVGVEWRGGYYDNAGVVRDMVQNHLFQMMAYLCMEPPTSFDAEAIRNEKHKLLNTVRILKHEEVQTHAVRGQYDAGFNPDGTPAKAYRDEPHVAPDSNTETFAAIKLRIDNWRWDGVPVYLRSGKGMSRKSTEIVVQFKQAPDFTFRGTPAAEQLEANQLIFRIQPKEGIELHFLAKRPGPSMNLRNVNMRFEYDEAFVAQPGTGYETMLYDCMRGDASLFSRSDLVETSWKIVQPILDVWGREKDETLPNYPFGSWGPKASFSLLSPRDKRRWPTRSSKLALRKIPMFEGSDEAMLSAFSSMLKSVVFDAGDQIVNAESEGHELFIIRIGTVEIRNEKNKVLKTLQQDDIFGELSLLSSAEQLTANAYAKTYCALYTMSKRDFCRVLTDNPLFAESMKKIAKERYDILIDAQDWVDSAAVNTEGA